MLPVLPAFLCFADFWVAFGSHMKSKQPESLRQAFLYNHARKSSDVNQSNWTLQYITLKKKKSSKQQHNCTEMARFISLFLATTTALRTMSACNIKPSSESINMLLWYVVIQISQRNQLFLFKQLSQDHKTWRKLMSRPHFREVTRLH